MEQNTRSGSFITSTTAGEVCKAYVPAPLPFQPPLNMELLQPILDKANHALGVLDGVMTRLPDISLLLYFFIRKEALLSSQIEGTQSSLDDLLLYESDHVPGAPLDEKKN